MTRPVLWVMVILSFLKLLMQKEAFEDDKHSEIWITEKIIRNGINKQKKTRWGEEKEKKNNQEKLIKILDEKSFKLEFEVPFIFKLIVNII